MTVKFWNFHTVLTLALIPWVAVNLCPGEFILVTELELLLTSAFDLLVPKGLGNILDNPSPMALIQHCDSWIAEIEDAFDEKAHDS